MSVKFILAVGIAVSLPIAVTQRQSSLGTVNGVAHTILNSLPLADAPNKATQTSFEPAILSDSVATDAHIQPVTVLAIVWLTGVLLIVSKDMLAWIQVKRLLRHSHVWTPFQFASEAEALLVRCGLKRRLEVRSYDDLAAPALIGLFKPTVLLPSDLHGASSGALCSALAHEVAHLKRRDVAWTLVGEAAKAMFWFHPFAWIACREQRVEAEIAADQLARTWTESSPKQYAQHLLEWIDPLRDTLYSVRAVPGLLLSTHELIRRLNAMALSPYSRRSTIGFAAILTVPIALGVVPVALVGISQSGLADSVWPKFHGGPQSTGRAGGAGATGNKIWSVKTGDEIESSPVIGSDGTVYIGSADQNVYAFDGNTGKQKWVFKTEGAVMSTPAIGSDGTVYVGSEDNSAYAIDGSGGAKKWAFETGGLIYAGPAIGSDGIVYVGSWDGNFYALNGATGDEKWWFKANGPITSSAAIGTDGTVYVGSHGGSLYALNGLTGAKKWEFKAGDTVNPASVGSDGTVYVGSWDGNVYAIDGATGHKKWSWQTGGKVDSCPAIGSDGTVYVGSFDHRLYALDGASGARKWSFTTGGSVFASPAIGSDGTIYVGSADGRLYALAGETGAMNWSFKAMSGLDSSPTLSADGTVYLGSGDGHVYAVR